MRTQMFFRFVVAAFGLFLSMPKAALSTNVGGNITTDTIWSVAGGPNYVVISTVYVEKANAGAATPILTIDPGVTVSFNGGTALYVGYNFAGELHAGAVSPAATVTFTAAGSTTPGFWGGIKFWTNATNSSYIKNASVRYGGQTNTYGGIHVNTCSPTLQALTVQNNAYAGISVSGGAAPISGSTISANPWGITIYGSSTASLSTSTVSNNTAGGIWVGSPAYPLVPTKPSLTTVTISSNTGFAISVDAKVTFTTATGLTVTGNTRNAIEMRGYATGGVIADMNAQWKSLGFSYVVTGSNLYVERASSAAPTPILTIDPGVTVAFSSGTTLFVGYNYAGELHAGAVSPAAATTFTADGSTAPGFWNGIKFWTNATSGSYIKNASIRYGGVNNVSGGIYVQACSPTLDAVTVQNNAYAGISVWGGAPQITGSTLSSNPWGVVIQNSATALLGTSTVSGNTSGGIYVGSPAYPSVPSKPSLTTVAITGNTGFAISMDAKVSFTTATGLTVTGNTTNAIEIRGYTVGVICDMDTQWKSLSIPYVVTGDNYVEKANSTAPTPILTIDPGVTVSFNSGTNLYVGYNLAGELHAGAVSPAAAVTFTANGSTTPGFWRGIKFWIYATPGSYIKNASVKYGGQDNVNGGIYVNASSPTIQYVSLQNNIYAGISVNGGTPVITNCSFSGNTYGLLNHQYLTTTVVARFNFWNSIDGPNGTGGQIAGQGVAYEPWLVAAGSTPNYLNAYTQKNRLFNPAIPITTTLGSTSVQSAAWQTDILNSSGASVRTYTGTGTTWTVIWDGKNGSGVDQPDGTYTYQFASSGATAARGLSILDRTKVFTISSLAVDWPFFSPNADGVQDLATVSGANLFDNTTFTVNVKNSGGTIVRTSATTALTFAYPWDGKNASAVVQPEGVYTFQVVATNGTASTTSTITTTLDVTPPTASISVPLDGSTVSNVYTNGVTDVAVTGSTADTNFSNWVSDWGVGGSPSSYTGLSTGSAAITNASLGTWATAPLTNGLYTVRLQAYDKAGNKKTVTSKPTVGNFSVSHTPQQLNVASSGTTTISSIIPFNLTETLVVKNAAGTVVRTLVNALARSAGTTPDVWNGKTAAGAVLPDGGYFYAATVTDGTHNLTWDQTNQFIDDGYQYGRTINTGYDFFNNKPMSISYNFTRPGRVSVGLAPSGDPYSGCPPPDYCVLLDKYDESGPHTVYFSGADSTGKFVGGMTQVQAWSLRSNFAKNATVVYGTSPVVTNVTVTPPVFGPAVGTQTVAFDLASYLNQAVGVTIAFVNQGSVSALRTITLASQAPGHVVLTWDGKADNAMWVAPGFYTVTVTATDAAGNRATGQILTTVLY